MHKISSCYFSHLPFSHGILQEKYIWSRVWRNVLCSFNRKVWLFLGNMSCYGSLFVYIVHSTITLSEFVLRHRHNFFNAFAGLSLYQLVFLGFLVGRLPSFLLWLQVENIKAKYETGSKLCFVSSPLSFMLIVSYTGKKIELCCFFVLYFTFFPFLLAQKY